jgi:rRNA maturation protein Nop10
MDKCPHCGNEEFYRKGMGKGMVFVNERFDGEQPFDNSQMYTEIDYTLGKTRWCNNCGKKLKDATPQRKDPETE